jgi:hypothetical protein
VATAAIRPPIYLIRYPRCRAGPATPGVRAGSGSMVLAPGSNADRRAWSTIRRQPARVAALGANFRFGADQDVQHAELGIVRGSSRGWAPQSWHDVRLLDLEPDPTGSGATDEEAGQAASAPRRYSSLMAGSEVRIR